jgi:hypothetical protein
VGPRAHGQPAAPGADRGRQPRRVGTAGDPGSGRTARRSIVVRLPGADTSQLEAALADSLRATGVERAYLAETDAPGGARRLLLGLVGEPGASATVDVPDGTEVVWLEEPLLAQVQAVVEPFYRRRG